MNLSYNWEVIADLHNLRLRRIVPRIYNIKCDSFIVGVTKSDSLQDKNRGPKELERKDTT